MSLNTWVETLVTQQAIGTAFGTYTTSKSVINPQALYTLPPGFWSIGKCLEIEVRGAISNIVTTPGTVTFEVKLGPTANIVAFTTGAIQLNATAHTLLPFSLSVMLTCRAIGSTTTANLIGQGALTGLMFTRTAAQIDDANTPGAFMAPATTPTAGTGFDSTTSSILDFWTGFSISNAANVVRIDQYSVKAIN